MNTPKLGHDPKKIAKLVANLSMDELHQALEYVEKVAEGSRSATQHILEKCKEFKIDPADAFEEELRKLWQIFEEHNDYSFAIEKQMDLRMKRLIKNRYGAKTLMDVGDKVGEKFRDLFGEQAKPSEGVDYK